MDLKKEEWNESSIEELNNHLYEIRREEKIDFIKRVVNTNMIVLGIPNPILKSISKEILKGNYISYLDFNNSKYYECTIINSYLISNIKDIKIIDKYLNMLYVDNWSTCDVLKFNIKGSENEYLKLSKKFINNKNIFKRRIGIKILFSFKNSDYLDEIFNIIDSMYLEEEYYVNMIIAWLLCELFIINRDKTFEYLNKTRLGKFTINKMISKCRDSFRVSKSDKDMLLQFKK